MPSGFAGQNRFFLPPPVGRVTTLFPLALQAFLFGWRHCLCLCVLLSSLQAHAAEPVSQTVAMRTALALKAPIEQGLLEVEAVDRYIVIRIPEKAAFAPEATTLRPAYLPVLATVRAALKKMDAVFTVAGYTDDVAINTARYRSNWEFAASRASAVLVELLKTSEISPDRMTLVSYGGTRALVANTSVENRERNRRIEIIIQQ